MASLGYASVIRLATRQLPISMNSSTKLFVSFSLYASMLSGSARSLSNWKWTSGDANVNAPAAMRRARSWRESLNRR